MKQNHYFISVQDAFKRCACCLEAWLPMEDGDVCADCDGARPIPADALREVMSMDFGHVDRIDLKTPYFAHVYTDEGIFFARSYRYGVSVEDGRLSIGAYDWDCLFPA